MMAELGMPYLFFAISALHNACPARGYTAHVLGYTLHAVLETLSKVPQIMSVAVCLASAAAAACFHGHSIAVDNVCRVLS